MGRQIGFFFFVVGLLVILLFGASFQVRKPEYLLCLGGIASLMLGAFLVYKYRRKPAENTRFRMIKKIGNREKKNE